MISLFWELWFFQGNYNNTIPVVIAWKKTRLNSQNNKIIFYVAYHSGCFYVKFFFHWKEKLFYGRNKGLILLKLVSLRKGETPALLNLRAVRWR